MSFLNIQGGYGLMGAANSGLVCCNGYERWRMHWKHPQSVDYISARNMDNTQSVVSDISREDGNQTFILRDFVTYGDVVRIKLPYKDSVTSSNQYIWLENHQVGKNGKLDFLQFSNTSTCRPQGGAGIYAYYQIGRDILEGSYYQVWDTCHRDNLKVIPAEGYYDYELVPDTHTINCVNYEVHYYSLVRGTKNPFCGGHDQETHFFPQASDTVLYSSREYYMWRKIINGQNDNLLPSIGDTLDVFSTHRKINMGTNPSTCNAKTYHSNNSNPSNIISAQIPQKNTATTYLTGLSIEMTPIHGTGTFQVRVRWDDYKITNDCRWTGDIVLKDTAILTSGNTITLAQNRTVAQTTRDHETGLFAKRTQWTCEGGSYFRQDSSSTLVLTEKSSMVFLKDSKYEMLSTAGLQIMAGCTLDLRPRANVRIGGTLTVDSGGVALISDTAYLTSSARLIVRPGGKLIVDGGTLTSACAGEMWQGIEVVGDRTKHQTAANQGTVILQNGATIENAHCAIRTGLEGNEWLTAGGIVQCSGSTFRNNRRAVSFYSYADTLASGNIGDNKSWFKDCTFTLNNDNLFLSQNMEFLNHVTLWDVKGVSFEGCTFENLTTGNIPDRKHAIYAENAGFKVKTLCNTLDGCNCYGTADTNRFTGFSTAVEACNAGSPYAVTIDEAKFVNNATGVSVQASNYATVTRCVFDLSTNPLNGRNVAGLLLSNTIGYHVEGNAFTATPNNAPLSRWGVHVNKSMKLNNSLYRNSFRNLNRGISVTDTNGLGRNGLCFSCNTFEDCAYGIYVSANGIIASMQGNLLKGVDNSFTGTQTSSLYNLGPTQINYYHSSNTGFILHLPTGVYTESDLATANPCTQTVCDQGGNVNPVTNFNGMDVNGQMEDNQDVGANDHSPLQTAINNYYAAVRGIMRDSVENLQALAAWHSAAGIYADPYSLTEVATALGTADVSNISSSQLSQPELDNFMAFRTLAASLRPNASNPAVNWPVATPAQIAELQRIAEANTGRSSSTAKGVLCFFFDICYEEDEGETRGHLVETFHGTSLQNGTDGGLLVYPNPTDGMLYVALSNAEEFIGRIVIANLTGREVAAFAGPGERIDVTALPAGVYILTVTSSSGNSYNIKFVKTAAEG